MPTLTSRPSRTDVRARIIAAATDAFLAHGYDATAVADIAERAGFTKGAVYSNFGGKPELFAAVCVERYAVVAGLALATSQTFTVAQPARDAIGQIAHALAEQVVSDTWPNALAEFRSLAARDTRAAEVYGELRTRQRADLEAQLRAGADALGLPPDFDYVIGAHLLLTCFHALALEHAAAPSATPRSLIEASFHRLLTGLTA